MKRLLLPLVATFILVACNNDAEGDTPENDTLSDTSAGNPAVVHPPSEAITDSTQLVNDSVVVPKTAPSSGSESTGDTVPR